MAIAATPLPEVPYGLGLVIRTITPFLSVKQVWDVNIHATILKKLIFLHRSFSWLGL